MNYLILAQDDLKSGRGHLNRSLKIYKYFKTKKIAVKFFKFSTKKNFLFINNKKFTLIKNLFLNSVNSANVIITDEITCPKTLIEIIKNKFICSISPIAKSNKFANIIFTRPIFKTNHNKRIYIDSKIENFLPGSEIMKFKRKFLSKNKIGISMGGYEKNNKTIKILKILKKIEKKISISILISSRDKKYIQEKTKEIRHLKMNTKIFTFQKNAWSLFMDCDLVLLSGGISSYESVFNGIPSINLINDNNKLKLMSYLIKKKLTKVFKINNNKEIFNFLNSYISNTKKILKEKKKIQKFNEAVKIRGNENLLSCIEKIYSKYLTK